MIITGPHFSPWQAPILVPCSDLLGEGLARDTDPRYFGTYLEGDVLAD